MKKSEVVIGKVYVVKVSGSLTKVRLDRESQYGGWDGTNLRTMHRVRIRSAAKLRREFVPRTEQTVSTCQFRMGQPGMTWACGQYTKDGAKFCERHNGPFVRPGTGPEPLYKGGVL